ncbi:MAG: lytic transglycosylase domain-containing protein [Sphingorhabdus sp.]
MKIFFLGSLGLGLVFATPTAASKPSAQTVEQSDQPSTSNARVEQGYRISDRGDFQIVEHGHWSPPYRPAPTQHLASEAVFSVQRPHHDRKSTKFRSNFQRTSYLGDVYAAEARFGIPHGLLDALIWTESRYNPKAVSSAGAAGLGQLMPGTARDLGVRNRFDPKANIIGAAQYLRQMLDRFGVVHLAVAAYNAGPGAVSRLGRIPLNGETPGYVRNVLDRWALN